MTQASNPESGLRNHRIEFVRESTVGTTPSDPAWNLYSDNMQSAVVWEADAQVEAQDGLSTADPVAHFAGPEDHTATVEYDLQQFFVDGSGNPLDAAGDAILRDSDNAIHNSHTVVDRRDDGSTRSYVVLKGAFPNLDELNGDPSTGLPVTISLEYEVKKGRSYVVDQPGSSETLTISSTDDADSTQTLTLEQDDGTTEDVSLNGTTDVTTAETYSDLDAFELDGETVGNVTIEDSSQNVLVTLYGSDAYDGVEGDLGVPVTGSGGSHASAIGSSYERFLSNSVTGGGSALAAELRGSTLSVSNNYDKTAIDETKQMAIHPGNRDIEFEATTAGNFESHNKLDRHLRSQTFDVVWNFDGGSITLSNSTLVDAGEVGPSADDVISTIDNTFEPDGITVSSS